MLYSKLSYIVSLVYSTSCYIAHIALAPGYIAPQPQPELAI